MVKSESRKLVLQTLALESPPRAPRQIWDLPWTYEHYPHEIARLKQQYPEDIVWCPQFLKTRPVTKGERYGVGEFTDEWGSVFQNRLEGIIGEVKQPVILGEEWAEREALRIPWELASIDTEAVNAFCREEKRFVVAGSTVRPFERLQFLRTTEELMMDLALQPEGMNEVTREIHQFYCDELCAWGKTEVDALFIQDDWGSQLNLLINPETWRQIFKPLYREYVQIAHQNNKKLFMHSDGNILSILPDLVEIGVDALNSQIFCMGIENLRAYRGQITFWGEMDRQNLLPNGTTQDIDKAVAQVVENLWDHGGCIAQCDFGIGAKPENVAETFKAWDVLLGTGGIV